MFFYVDVDVIDVVDSIVDDDVVGGDILLMIFVDVDFIDVVDSVVDDVLLCVMMLCCCTYYVNQTSKILPSQPIERVRP